MLLKSAAKTAVCWLLLVAVIPSLLLNVGANRGVLIHDHEDEDAHVHVIHGSPDAVGHHDRDEELAADERDTRGDGHTDIVILGSDLVRPRHTTAADAPALIHALPMPSSMCIGMLAILPASHYSSGGMGAGPPNVSLACQTCVQFLV
jgi:hypothetical protein